MALRGFSRLLRGLKRTREGIAHTFRSFTGTHPVDDAVLDELEAALLGADLGPSLTEEVLEEVRGRARKEGLTTDQLRDAVRRALAAHMDAAAPEAGDASARPRVIFVVGVNGSGKTTTVGKLAARMSSEGRTCLVAAADTFRAAAIDQLEQWARRAGVEVVKHQEGGDAAAVVFDALRAARARDADAVLVDTAGRLHTKRHLMAELGKLARVAGREVPGAPHEVLLVLDATTGQNGVHQAREFTQAIPVTGVVLTKLDGTAKGGVALLVQRELGVPIRYVGVGEAVEDLLDFDPEAYLDGLVGAEDEEAA